MGKRQVPGWLPLLLGAFAGALLIALAAQVSFTVPGIFRIRIPVTLQSLAVLVMAFWLRRPAAVWMVLIYLLAGIAGLPVFSGGAAGLEVIKGDTGGYLLGFLAGAFVTALLAERGWSRSLDQIIGALTVGTVVILLFGVLRLYIGYGLDRALTRGFLPLLPGAVLKILAGAILIWGGNKWAKKKQGQPLG